MAPRDVRTRVVRVLRPGQPMAQGLLTLDGPACILGSLTPADEAAAEWRSGVYMSPGWIDLHCHVFDGVGSLGVSADRVGWSHGVHHLVDAGSAGAYTIDGFRIHVVDRSEATVSAWLNVSAIGLVTGREYAHREYLDVEAGVDAFRRHGDVLCGVKVRSCREIVGELGLEPLAAAVEMARQVDRPLMVHIGKPPPDIDSVLSPLRAGDIVTHCYHGKAGAPWQPDGRPVAALRSALERGVRLDVGHGAASYDPDAARKAIAQGCGPHTVSTDIHARSIDGPVHGMANVLGALAAAGLPMDAAVSGVTAGPADVLGLKSRPALVPGQVEQATVFNVELIDGADAADGHQAPRITVLGVVTNGQWRPM